MCIRYSFAAYYQLYCKYGEDYGILRILQGLASPEEYKRKTDMAAGAAFDERFTVVNLLLGGMDDILRAYSLQDKRVAGLYLSLIHIFFRSLRLARLRSHWNPWCGTMIC